MFESAETMTAFGETLFEPEVYVPINTIDRAVGFNPCPHALADFRDSWSCPEAADGILANLDRAGWHGESLFSVGYMAGTAEELDAVCRIRDQSLSSFSGQRDYTSGAPVRSTLQMAAVGYICVCPETNHRVFQIDCVGFYVKHQYDDQAVFSVVQWGDMRGRVDLEDAIQRRDVRSAALRRAS